MRLLFFILLIGFVLRLLSIYPNNIVLGFDQARDLFASRRIFMEGDLRVVGPTAGNNAALHHGVAFLYFIIPPIFLGGGNPLWVSLWISLFNLASAFVLYLFAKSLFKSEKAGLIAVFLAAISYYFVGFSGWISNPSPTLLTVPLAFYGLWEYKKGKRWGLPLGLFSLGLSIQFELFFLYLIPVFALLWLILKPSFPKTKLSILSLLVFGTSLSSMIATEIKFHFSGILSLLSDLVRKSGSKPPFLITIKEFLNRYFETFSLNLFPTNKAVGVLIGLLALGYLVYLLSKSKKDQKLAFILLLVYLLSPFSMLLLGFHAAPWVLIGLPPAIILLSSFVLSKLRPELLLLGLLIITISNVTAFKEAFGRGQSLLGPDESSIVSKQLASIDYTYQKAEGTPFAINTVTNPLYINAVWAWNYKWYGEKKYGYLPGWLGGDQDAPYDLLTKGGKEEALFFLILDESPRIPEIHRLLAQNWAMEHGKLLEEKSFKGIKVLSFKTIKPF